MMESLAGDTLAIWLTLVFSGGTLSAALGTWLRLGRVLGRQEAQGERIASLEGEQKQLYRDVTHLRAQFEGAP